ncbi:tetratricopeptide repeat protein [Parapedobacter indicus]|uniref:Tetratricopeptide repeat-containing protein n=1 Tax=Parapedobacter indicus TaxID=1477437 RepID=A0A1I3QKM3_9SPHI|nr:tetratricopeptide repeat protein [Parapedobacter indicus]PPL00130.1 tetratricopeptide repeat protein [Parapedobacter indicus]SFJ33841.1 Tetratricopeptide repeat-containing protein [Parapedobacter indicus]
MKVKSILLGTLVLASSAAFSQTSNLRKAKASYDKFNEVKSVGNSALGVSDLNTAKEALDKAIEHEKTMNLAETWTYYALVNADLALLDSTEASEQYVQKAVEAREKAISLDTEKENEQNLNILGSILAQYELNKGAKLWDSQDFVGAYNSFDKGLTYLPGDTTLLYYSGMAAVNAQDYEKALAKYVELVPVDSFSNNRQIILDVSRLYLMQGDTANAIKYAEIGTQKYPEDGELATQHIELNLMAGNDEQTIKAINDQVAKDPDNKNLHYYLGIAYNETGDIEKAEASYKKALEIDPNYLDANINLGGLILNKGIDHFNKTNNANLQQAEYDVEIKKAYDIFDTALPYLQKAVEIDGKSQVALTNLKRYYEIKEDQAKIDELQARLDALQ